ncbi:MAG TPA: TIGR03435 family protein [Candidatus Limnocylindrales bacterium]|nr:TIGR03435 family protein [Candidatus Limnocylindrales bacterium]
MKLPAALLLLLLAHGQAQTPSKLTFEVASIKPNTSGGQASSNFPLGNGNVFRPTGGVFSAINQPFTIYLQFAFKIPATELARITAKLPHWAITDRFDIQARANVNATKDQMREMMQSLLEERFKLAIHYEEQQVPGYALVLVKAGQTGPNLRPNPNGAGCNSEAGPPDELFPAACGGIMPMPYSERATDRRAARNVPIALLASSLPGITHELDKPVVDRTGLTGNYDFSLEWASSQDDTNLGQAMRLQLGLKLESQKIPMRLLIIDRVERPSAN